MSFFTPAISLGQPIAYAKNYDTQERERQGNPEFSVLICELKVDCV